MNKAFLSSELTLDDNNKVYHLGLSKNDIADTIILVGDPARVDNVGSFFDTIRFRHSHREFSTITGIYKGKELTVLSHGIGCDNIDIVINELDAVVNINLNTRTENTEKKSLKLIRIGTCGALQEEIKPGSYIISKYALGLDSVANFYQIPFSQNEIDGLSEFKENSNWPDDLVIPYLIESSATLSKHLKKESIVEGITVTANGFYGPQGRELRIPLKYPDFKEKLRSFEWNQNKVTNLEMETSGLYALSKALGHEAVSICLVLANRYSNEFESNYEEKMKVLIEYVLRKMVDLK